MRIPLLVESLFIFRMDDLLKSFPRKHMSENKSTEKTCISLKEPVLVCGVVFNLRSNLGCYIDVFKLQQM